VQSCGAGTAGQSVSTVHAVSIAFAQRLQPMLLKMPIVVRPETPARGWLYWMTPAPLSRRRLKSQFGATYSSSIAPSRAAPAVTVSGHALMWPYEFGKAGGFGTEPVTSLPTIERSRLARPSDEMIGA
jgi:hypothetical protein